MQGILLRLVAALALLISAPSLAQEKGAVREGFKPEALVGAKIVLMRPSVWVGEQSTGGMPEPNADWTAQARTFLDATLARRQSGFAVELMPEPAQTGDNALLVSEYRALFNSVASSVMNYQFFAGNRLPTRKHGPFDWTLGAGTKRLGELTGARYALFTSVNDQYGSTGRKMLQIFAAGLVGVGIQSGSHIGFAGLVDLETGHLLWLNADGQMGGDVRTADGMEKRVDQLLEDFPGLKPAATAP